MEHRWQTRETLIERARDPNDNRAWEDFERYYRDFIRMVLVKLNVDTDELEDLSQKLLVKLWEALPEFEYQPDGAKFRTWLTVVVRNVVRSHLRSKIARERREGDAAIAESTPPELESIIDREWRDHVVALVFKRLHACFSGKAVQVFELTLAGKSAEEISATLDLTTDSVYVLRNRVKARFLKETRRLRHELEF